MKIKAILTVIISTLFNSFFLCSQDDTKFRIDGKELNAKDAINLVLNENLENENIIKVGKYCLNTQKITVKYQKKNIPEEEKENATLVKDNSFFDRNNDYRLDERYKIKKVILSVSSSSIQRIFVYMEDSSLGVFTNQTNPIHNSVLTDSYRNDRLYSSNSNNSFIYIKDVISYYFNDPKYDFLGEKVFTLDNKDNQCQNIEYDGSINSIFNLVVYSDLLALIEDQENSLIQFDANVSVPLNQRSIRTNSRIFGGMKLVSQMDFDLILSKFDSQYQEVESNLSSDSLIQITPLSLYQQSYLNGKINITLVSWQLGKVTELALSSASYFSLAKIENPLDLNNESIESNLISFVPKLNFKTSPSPVLSVETSLSYFWQKYNLDANFEEIGIKNIVNPEVVINFKGNKENFTNFFVRFQYFQLLNENESFSQFQFGIKSSISNLLKSN